MKRMLMICVSCLPLLMLLSCGYGFTPSSAENNDLAAYTSEESMATTEEVAEGATIQDLMPHLELINTSFYEAYGAESENGIYLFKYNEDQTAENLQIVSYDESSEEDRYYSTATIDKISNFRTWEAWETLLREHLSEEIIDHWRECINNGPEDRFVEYNGYFYLVWGARGYGAVQWKLDTAKIVASEQNKCVVNVDSYYFSFYDSTYQVDFEYRKGRWIAVDYYPITESVNNNGW